MVHINALIGNFGKYHTWICMMIFLSKFVVGIHQMAIIFLAPPANYVCPQNSTCCVKPTYDETDFTRTIITEWNLICERSWLKDFTQTIYQFGVLIGSSVFGLASDRFGRRKSLLVAIILEIFTGFMAALMPDYWSFTIIRMFLGISVGGVTVVTFVLMMEFIGSVYRDVMSIIYHIPFTIGHIVLALFGYFIRDYFYFQIYISVTSLLQLFCICALPESPRWLISKNRSFKAIELMERIAEINGLPKHEVRPKIEIYQLESANIKKQTKTAIDLYRNSYLRTHILIMSFSWFVSGYCYYGISQYISHFTGNIFINVAASGSVSLGGCLLAIPLIKFIGRKILVIVFYIVSSISFIIIAIIPEGSGSVTMGCIADLFSFMAFIVLYLHCSEIFPTIVRNSAIGISSMMARFGSMIAPFVANFRSYGKWCAPLAFGIPPIFAAMLCGLLPEAKDDKFVIIKENGVVFNMDQNPHGQKSIVLEDKRH